MRAAVRLTDTLRFLAKRLRRHAIAMVGSHRYPDAEATIAARCVQLGDSRACAARPVAAGCWCPSCGRPGCTAAARPAYLCTERATVKVRDASGAEESMCLSHAAGALRQVDQLTVIGATDDEVRRLVAARDRPVRIHLSRRARRLDGVDVGERR